MRSVHQNGGRRATTREAGGRAVQHQQGRFCFFALGGYCSDFSLWRLC